MILKMQAKGLSANQFEETNNTALTVVLTNYVPQPRWVFRFTECGRARLGENQQLDL